MDEKIFCCHGGMWCFLLHEHMTANSLAQGMVVQCLIYIFTLLESLSPNNEDETKWSSETRIPLPWFISRWRLSCILRGKFCKPTLHGLSCNSLLLNCTIPNLAGSLISLETLSALPSLWKWIFYSIFFLKSVYADASKDGCGLTGICHHILVSTCQTTF